MTVLGENTCRLPDIVSIIADAFEREILEKNENPANRFLNIVRQLQVRFQNSLCALIADCDVIVDER